LSVARNAVAAIDRVITLQPCADPQCRWRSFNADYQREVPGPIKTVSADQAHAVLISDDHHPVALALDLGSQSADAGTLSVLVESKNP
jgi:hypothetical protein